MNELSDMNTAVLGADRGRDDRQRNRRWFVGCASELSPGHQLDEDAGEDL